MSHPDLVLARVLGTIISLGLLGASAGCNALTGATDLEAKGGGSESAGAGAPGGSGGSSSSSGEGGSGASAGGGGAPATGDGGGGANAGAGGSETGAGGHANSGAGGSGGEGGTTIIAGELELGAACAAGSECQSGMCLTGYCSRDCAVLEDCPDPMECIVKGEPTGTCQPPCEVVADCAEWTGTDCGLATASDSVEVTVCSDYGGAPLLPLDGSPCAEDEECNLGHTGTQRICLDPGCTTGCQVDTDCPAGQTCSAPGTPGTCGG